MKASRAENEGVRMLDEIVCDAKSHEPWNAVQPPNRAIGVNEGVAVANENACHNDFAQHEQTHQFRIVLRNGEHTPKEISNALQQIGCDDANACVIKGESILEFTRKAQSLENAIRSAIADVRSAGYEVTRTKSADEEVFSRINRELTDHSN